MKNIFIIGSKGIPAKYGGFETFVDELISRQKSKDIQYYVACLADNNEEFTYKSAICFNVNVPNIGSAKAVYYDIAALKRVIEIIKEKNLKDVTLYILAARIGPFMAHYQGILHKMGVKVYVNPDGHEWKRSKWNAAIKAYWKYSEKLMIKNTDLAICDSKAIEKYIKEEYSTFNPKTTFIAYGSDVSSSNISSENKDLKQWYSTYDIRPNEFYLILGRFVPENNYETMIREFMLSNSKKDLVIITNVEENKFYEDLKEKTKFYEDKRIKFVGTLYGKLAKKVREDAYAYLHGHEVGGTNPSLLESLASTKLNLLLDVAFNKEVAEDGALYFSKEKENLARLIDKVDNLSEQEIEVLAQKAKDRVINHYSWDYIVDRYEDLFLRE